MVIDHAFYMNLALNEAWKYQGLTYPNPAVGALLLDGNGSILSIGAHQKAGGPHAEVHVLKEGFLKLSDDTALCAELLSLTTSHAIHDFLQKNHHKLFHNSILYVTLEPCSHQGKTPPCSTLIAAVGIREVVIGSMDTNAEAAGGAAYLATQGTVVSTGICREQCDALIEPFRLWQKERFVFFKHAQRLNGSIDGGYISGESALDLVHGLRDCIDLIVIGGDTVRSDRPTLDARRTGGRAPDVLIYSRETDFDRTIPLFEVSSREVFIESSLDRIKQYRFVMIEGGGAMYNAVRQEINWHLTLISSSLQKGLAFDASGRERMLHTRRLGDDLMVWSRCGEA